MNQTPIQKAIAKLTEIHGMIISTSRYAEGFAEGLSGAIEELKQLLPYEEEYIKEQKSDSFIEGRNSINQPNI